MNTLFFVSYKLTDETKAKFFNRQNKIVRRTINVPTKVL